MIRHSLDMSHFRAINLPCKSPEKSNSRTRSPSNASSAPGLEPRHLSPKVVLPAKRSHASHSGPPADKGDFGRAVAQADEAIHALKKKGKKSGSSVSKPSRQQAPREKKLMYSIEQSTQKMVASPSPLEAKDSDYAPTAAELADTTLSTAQSTPSRRSPQGHAFTHRNTGSLAFTKPTPRTSALQPSRQAACPLSITKMESSAAGCNSPGPEVGLEPKLPSPSLWISPVRKERYQQDGLVELPKEVFEYERCKKAKKQSKKDMKARKRREKGKCAEQRTINEINEPNQRDQSEKKIGMKRAGEDMEKAEPRQQKFHHNCKSHESGLENRGVDSQHFNEDTASKHQSARSSSKHKSVERKAQRHTVSVVKTEGSKTMMSQRPLELEVPEERSGRFDDPALRSREQQRIPQKEDWRKPFERREMHLGDGGRTCSCSFLPDYFTRNPDEVPDLATWQATCRGGDREFFKHVKQISCCRGSVHPPHVIDACRRIANYSERWDTDSVVDFAQGVLSTNGSEDHNMRRAQSSIPPPVFYGSGGRYRPVPRPGSFSRFIPEMRKATSSLVSLPFTKPSKGLSVRPTPRNTTAKQDGVKTSTSHADRAVDQLTTPDAARNPTNGLAPPKSSVPGKRHRVHPPKFNVYDDSAPEEGIVGKEQTSSTLPKASKQPQDSFKEKRQRHQSVPANLPSRKPPVNELSVSPLPEPQRREGVLQELCNQAILQNMNKSLDPIKKYLKDLTEYFLPPPQAQNATIALAPAPAIAPIPNAAPQSGNIPERPRARKRKQKPVAERKRRLPELSRDVPAHLRLPDADLIAIGRNSSSYERHAAAPYAFTWHGQLLAAYDHLLDWGDDGWTAKEIKRVAR